MIILLISAVIALVALVVLLWILRINETEQENQLIIAYMNSMQSFYDMIRNRIEMTRRYRHDLAKHIQTLEALSERECSDDMQEYMDGLKIQYHQIKSEEYTSNEVINTVISIKKQQCIEKEIPLELQIGSGDYRAMKDIDMVGLLYNLLDNAVEASDRMSPGNRKGIRLQMENSEGKTHITVSNYVAPDEEVKFETYKEEKEEHGIGMKIIDYLVKKYHGKQVLEFESREHMLVVQVWLPRDYTEGTEENRVS